MMEGSGTNVPDGAAPTRLDQFVIALTSRLPDNWLGLRIAILLRRAVTMRLPGDSGLDVERWGLRMRLHPRRNGCEKGLLFTPQMFEAGERAELAAEIAKVAAAGRRFVFLDIGANVGLFSLFVASRAGAHARILAFEPDPESVRRMRFNVGANPGVPIEIFAIALGETAGSALLVDHARDRGATRTILGPDAGTDPPNRIRVPCRTLLEVLTEQGIERVDALKIDVEGQEDVILGPFFRQAPSELWPRLLIIEDSSEIWRVDLFSALRALGYVISTRTRLNVMMRR